MTVGLIKTSTIPVARNAGNSGTILPDLVLSMFWVTNIFFRFMTFSNAFLCNSLYTFIGWQLAVSLFDEFRSEMYKKKSSFCDKFSTFTNRFCQP